MTQTPDTERLTILARKYLKGTISGAEQKEFDEWFSSAGDTRELDLAEDEHRRAIFARIQKEIEASAKVRRLWPRTAAAASILLVLSFGAYFVLHQKQAPQQAYAIKPGHNQATLTLANGRKIILTKGLKGQLTTQGNVTISADTSAITYAGTDERTEYNTLSTARGEQSPYPLQLADGTKVWLNAESSITFPTRFGKNRTVKLTGEAYFEVKHDAMRPFQVETEKQTIEDIGTTFDINAYPDEPEARTTLIEGAVKVNGLILKPGQQAKGNNIVAIDPQTVVAWKNGEFRADNESLAEIFKQAERWYDIKVIYRDEQLKSLKFGVIGNRYANISGLLRDLELTQKVKFSIANKTIYISNPN